MKLSKTNIINKINEKVENVDLAIELIEDITDSMDITDELENTIELLNKDIEDLKSEIIELKEKYKSRFLSNVEDTEDTRDTEDTVDELKEDNVIDIKEI